MYNELTITGRADNTSLITVHYDGLKENEHERQNYSVTKLVGQVDQKFIARFSLYFDRSIDRIGIQLGNRPGEVFTIEKIKFSCPNFGISWNSGDILNDFRLEFLESSKEENGVKLTTVKEGNYFMPMLSLKESPREIYFGSFVNVIKLVILILSSFLLYKINSKFLVFRAKKAL
jgi:hypothetical protein